MVARILVVFGLVVFALTMPASAAAPTTTPSATQINVGAGFISQGVNLVGKPSTPAPCVSGSKPGPWGGVTQCGAPMHVATGSNLSGLFHFAHRH